MRTGVAQTNAHSVVTAAGRRRDRLNAEGVLEVQSTQRRLGVNITGKYETLKAVENGACTHSCTTPALFSSTHSLLISTVPTRCRLGLPRILSKASARG